MSREVGWTALGSRSREGPLFWVQRNRSRRERVRLAGVLMSALAGEVSGRTAVRAAKARETIEAVVDEEFRAHCRVSIGGDEVLVVEVDSPVLVHWMRRKWERVLSGAARRASGGALSRVRFEYCERSRPKTGGMNS